MRTLVLCLTIAAAGLGATGASPAAAAPTIEHRKELAEIRQDVTRVAGLVRQKKLDEADALLKSAEDRLQKIIEADKSNAQDRGVRNIRRLILLRRGALLKEKKGDEGVSFQNDVAPILKQHCLRCHGENPKGGLRLDTFAGIKQGGQSARRRIPLVVPGDPKRSLLTARLLAPADRRMPKGAGPLSAKEMQTIALWIGQGAKFDGESESAPIGDSDSRKPSKPKPKVTVAMATGSEKVSFKRDVAPFMVNICMRCHSGKTPRSGFSLETFEKLLQGGDSGRVVIPGDLDASRLWDLVGKQDPIKMPPGQLLITKTNWSNLKTWIEEGAKFDGDDPQAPLRSLVPTEQEMRAAELARLSSEEFVEHRRKRSDRMWRRVLPKEEPAVVETKEFFVYGNVSTPRLGEIARWADEHAGDLRKLFGETSSPLLKGKLTIFVARDRFGYEEFNQVLLRRDTPREMTGHSVVTANLEDAYVVLQDIGDTVTADSPGLKVSLIDHVTGALLQRSGGRLPDWVLRGTGLAIAAAADPKNEYIRSAREKVPELLRTLAKPEDLFANGTFSPAAVGPVGYTLVEFLLKAGGTAKFGQFVARLHRGESLAAAMKAVYRTEPKAVAQAYLVSVARKGRVR